MSLYSQLEIKHFGRWRSVRET